YRPRRRQPQSLGEELFLHPPRLTSSGGPFHTRRDGAKKEVQQEGSEMIERALKTEPPIVGAQA
ncbi:hypothetical protein, partial [Ralstonia mannitolilytica]|uniref:hypothetical protein n=1 Tax=Ralstonia mannitolilytica TaxID=105219 RepID=UPI002930CF98